MIALAIRTGIPPDVWLAQPPGYLATALDLLTTDDE